MGISNPWESLDDSPEPGAPLPRHGAEHTSPPRLTRASPANFGALAERPARQQQPAKPSGVGSAPSPASRLEPSDPLGAGSRSDMKRHFLTRLVTPAGPGLSKQRPRYGNGIAAIGQ